MQKAIFDFIKRRFKNRVSILHVAADISQVKRSILKNPSKRAFSDKTSKFFFLSFKAFIRYINWKTDIITRFNVKNSEIN